MDKADVTTRAELAACLRTLLQQRGLTYRTLARAAERLPRHGDRTPTLPSSTVSDMLSGKRAPSRDRLLTFLAACDVPPHEIPHWLTAWNRARTDRPAPTESTARRDTPYRPLIPIAVAAVISAALTATTLWAGTRRRPFALARP